MADNFCNNCGKQGHYYHQCRLPITSCGVIAYTRIHGIIHYLMICRKHTLGFMDFVIGKYNTYDYDYILAMFRQMTTKEKHILLTAEFPTIWHYLWHGNVEEISSQMTKQEDFAAQDKFNLLRQQGILTRLVQDSNADSIWIEPEWGFPKGRKNHREKDFDCAIREFIEETGYYKPRLIEIQNIMPIEEIFIGSNQKSYKHKYFVVYMDWATHNHHHVANYQNEEISQLAWKTYEEAMNSIRPYNLEKKDTLAKVHYCLLNYN